MKNKILNLKIPGIKLLQHPLFSGSFLMFGGGMAVNVINYLYHLIMGRLLGPVGYGVLASIFSLLYIVSIVPLSTSISIVKFISGAKNKKELSNIYYGIKSFAFKLSTILLLMFTLLSFPLAKFLNIQDTFSVFVVGIVMFFSILTLVNQATLQGLLKFQWFVIPNLVLAIAKLLLGIVFVFFGFSVGGAVVGILIASIFAYVVSTFSIRGFVARATKTDFNTRKFIKYSIPVLLQAFAFTSIFSVDVLLAKHFLSPFEAGVYASLSTLGKVVFFATSPIASVMFPIISKRHSGGIKYKKILFLSLLLTAAISLIITVIYYFFPRVAISTLFGKEYLDGASSLIFMAGFMVLYSISYLLVNYFLSIGKTIVVVLPILAALIQGLLIYFHYHSNKVEIVNTSLVVTLFLTVSLLVLLKNEKI